VGHRRRRPHKAVVARTQRGKPRRQLASPALDSTELRAGRRTTVDQNGGYRASLCGGGACIAHALEKQLVDTIIITQFWMEGDDEYRPFTRSYAVTFDLSKNFDTWPVLRDPRSADEDSVDGAAVYSDLERRFEAPNLTAERVPLGADVDDPQVLAVEHYQPGAGPEDRFAGGVESSERVSELFALNSESDCRRLSTWKHEAVEAIEVSGDAHFANQRAET
jgi:hypothetical protein